MLYRNLRVIIKQKSVIDKDTGRKEFEHNTKDRHQITKEEKRTKKKKKNPNLKTIYRMLYVHQFSSVQSLSRVRLFATP